MKKKISLYSLAIVSVLFVLSIYSMRLNARPTLYFGLIIAALGVFLIGLFSNRYIAAILGGGVFILGYYLRQYYPEVSKLKDDKLKTFLIENEAYNSMLAKYFVALLIGFILIGFLSGLLGENLKRERENLFSTKKITYMAIFIALSVLINSLRIGSISFGGFPIILSGYLLGGIPGFIVGALADIVGFLIRPSSQAFNILFVLTSALTGLIPVVVTNALGDKYPKFTLIKVFIGVLVGQMITTVTLVPIFRVLLFGANTFWFYAGRALINQVVNIPLYAFLVTTLSDRITKVIDFDKEFI